MSDAQNTGKEARDTRPTRLRDALRQARIEAADRTGVVVELRDGDQLYYAAAGGTSADLTGLRLPLNASLSGMSILTGQPLQCDDSEVDSRVNRPACRRVNLRSMIVVPIPHGGHHQRQLAVAIKRAREMALLPYVTEGGGPPSRSRSGERR